MFVEECNACHRLILRDDYGGELQPELRDKAKLIYPAVIDHHSIPVAVRYAYLDAKRIQHLNVEAFCLLIRKCIEIICKIENLEQKNLQLKIKSLCEKYNLPTLISDTASKIRILGNQAAHDIDEIHPLMAHQIDEFFVILLEYLYILPNRLKWFDNFRKNNNKEHNGLLTTDGCWVIQKGKYQDNKF
jgi:hypothetical protein